MTVAHATIPNTAPLRDVQQDLLELERDFPTYIEQESLKADIECLRSWIEACQHGDEEATNYLCEHGPSLLENVKTKLQTAAREIQRIDEESPGGANFNGGKADRLTEAAKTAIDAEHKLAEAMECTPPSTESAVVAK